MPELDRAFSHVMEATRYLAAGRTRDAETHMRHAAACLRLAQVARDCEEMKASAA